MLVPCLTNTKEKYTNFRITCWNNLLTNKYITKFLIKFLTLA